MAFRVNPLDLMVLRVNPFTKLWIRRLCVVLLDALGQKFEPRCGHLDKPTVETDTDSSQRVKVSVPPVDK